MDSNGSLLGRVYQPDTALNPERRFLLYHVGFDKTIVRASGNYLFDRDGTRYLDALAQYGAVPFGHNPPAIWQCLDELRAADQPSFVQPLLNDGAETLARRLIGLCPNMSRVTFVNSGAEATEVAIKLARARTGRRKIVTVERGFHGKTNAALCATANPRYREPFLVDEDHFAVLPFGDLEALETALRAENVAAFLIEPVQGEGGMRVQPPGYLAAARELCRRHGTLFAVDEVQTGLGRTGALFGFMQHGAIEPDMVLLAKALGGGLVPIGAVLCTEEAWTPAFGMLHSSTFANGQLAASVGSAVLTELEADGWAYIERVSRLGARLRAGLDRLAARYPAAIASIQGQGLMQGVELQPWSGEISYFNAHASHCGYAVPIVSGYLLNSQRVLTAPTFNTSNVLRIQPSLSITEQQVDTIVAAVESTMSLIDGENFAELFSSLVPMPATADDSMRLAVGRTRRLQPKLRVAKPPTAVRKSRFAFLIHPTDDDARFAILPPAIKDLGAAAKHAWLAWMDSWSAKMRDPAPVFHIENVPSLTGASAEGWLIATSLTPEQMIRMGADARAELMQKYVDEARKLDVDIVGLGAFTSVVSQGGMTLADAGVNITTGNSLTAIASAASLLRYAYLRADSVDDERFAVVGAAGSVGRLVAFHLAHSGARRLRLIGNANNKRALTALKSVGGEILLHTLRYGTADDERGLAVALRQIAKDRIAKDRLATLKSTLVSDEESYAKIYDEFATMFAASGLSEPPIDITTDVAKGVADARFVVTATSAGRSFITADSFMRGAVVCDVARPLDVLHKMSGARADVLVFEGGLMRLPANLRFGDQNVLGYPPGVNLACLSESIVLALEGAKRHYSLGNRIDYREALGIFDAALKHGFDLYFDPNHAQPEESGEDIPAFEVDLAALANRV
jgi:acetylornithine/succinyldiaminopimelate/putrescine aminotransferase/predicted amino acid dehydrogenase